MAGLYPPLPTLRRRPRGRLRTDRGRRGLLLLHRSGVSPHTPCQSPGALTYWFPDQHRARINSGFTLALPIAVASGAPVSTALLGLNGLFGLRGWQVMYILEAIPTVLIGIAVFFYLTDRPSEAHWLNPEEREGLTGRMIYERQQIGAH